MWRLVGHDWAVDILARALAAERLAHAYLFTGEAQIGKRTLALEFAGALNCQAEDVPCGECRACRATAEGNHPDVILIDGQNKIKIEQIRDLQRQLALSPYEGKFKVCIITDLHLASTEAANALLKTLEEPPSRVVLLLTAISTEALLPTVVSRCQVMALRPLASELVINHLVTHEGQTPERAAEISRWASGQIGWAIQAARDASLVDEKARRASSLAELLSMPRYAQIRAAEQLAKRDDLRQTLELWQLWWRDVLLTATGHEALVMNVGQTTALRQNARLSGEAGAAQAYRAVSDALIMIDQNVNPRLALEALMLAWD
ncbi:MAG: DNA polymerase III subunit delta' [Chloroflexi bacterium]|nr:DNA polymerase III subunit delta' [Chloroflexota bacterium]